MARRNTSGPPARKRADLLLVERGLFESRARAQAAIEAGLVTANDKAKLYGAAVPALTYSLGGFVNGENATTAGVTGVPSLTTLATIASPVGQYAIHVVPSASMPRRGCRGQARA